MELILLLVFMTGILSFLTPCIIPMIVVYLTTITGLSMNELNKHKEKSDVKRHIIISTFVFVSAFTIVFTIFGGMAGLAGSFLTSFADTMAVIGGIILIVLGLYITGVLSKIGIINKMSCSIKNKFQIKGFRKSDGRLSYIGVFLVGFFFAIVCSHCIGPTLYSVLIYAASAGSVQIGMIALLIFSIGLGIPFIILSFFLGNTLGFLNKFKSRAGIVPIILGIIIIIFGILMVTGNFHILSSIFSQITPDIGVGMRV